MISLALLTTPTWVRLSLRFDTKEDLDLNPNLYIPALMHEHSEQAGHKYALMFARSNLGHTGLALSRDSKLLGIHPMVEGLVTSPLPRTIHFDYPLSQD